MLEPNDIPPPSYFRDRVERGAALLDSLPEMGGWRDRINQDSLAMSSCDECILGQLYGEYIEGFRRLILSKPASVLFRGSDHGFTLPSDEQWDPVGVVQGRFQSLAQCWRDYINEKPPSNSVD
jgi:hypothetical protein